MQVLHPYFEQAITFENGIKTKNSFEYSVGLALCKSGWLGRIEWIYHEEKFNQRQLNKDQISEFEKLWKKYTFTPV